ncbi:uncharacterized protein LOC142098220 [Mixophyes fleayi]|uniref:uncharacterized protein LOC142098220 n=1 Tax=Mixophyes fleayi TaxID=3061075 RepID=UPI003F4DD3C7
MRRPRPPACSAVVSSASGSGGGDMPAGAPVSHTAGVMPASAQAAYVSPSRGSAGEGRVGVGSGPLVEERGSGLGVFIQCPITPPISARRGDMQTYNPPAPHQLHFPPSPFLPHSGRGSSWGAHHGGAPLFDMGPFRPYTPGTDRVQSVRLGQRHVGSDRPIRGNMEVFGDSPSAPVRPSLSRHVLPATGEWTYRSRRAPSPSGAYASTSQCRPGPTRDNLAYDYHHSSGGNTSQWSPPRRTQSRPSGFFEEPYRAPYDEVPPQRRVISGGYYSPSPILPSRLDPSGPALGLARRRLDYLPRSQLTAPLCVSEPVVANQEMRAVGGGRSGSESRDQRSAGIRVEPIPGSTDAQPGSASVVEAPVAAGNPAPHGESVSGTTHDVQLLGSPVLSTSSGSSDSGDRPRKLIKLLETKLLGKRSKQAPQSGGEDRMVARSDLGQVETLEITHGIRPSVRDRIRRGKYVDMFALTGEGKKALAAAFERSGMGEDRFRLFTRWSNSFSIFARAGGFKGRGGFKQPSPQKVDVLISMQAPASEAHHADLNTIARHAEVSIQPPNVQRPDGVGVVEEVQTQLCRVKGPSPINSAELDKWLAWFPETPLLSYMTVFT